MTAKALLLFVLLAVVVQQFATVAGYYNVIYYNSNTRPLAEVANYDYTHLIMGFAYFNQASGICASPGFIFAPELQGHCTGTSNPNWATDFQTIKSAGIKIMFSLGGAAGWDSWWQELSTCTSVQLDAVAMALADFIKGNNECSFAFDGVDLDPEGVNVNTLLSSDAGLNFFANFIFAIRKYLPAPTYWLSHAPQAPYICPTTTAINCPSWAAGSYYNSYVQLMLKADSYSKTVLQHTDFLSVQYYPNGNLNCQFSTTGCGLRDWYTATANGYTFGSGTFSMPANKLVIGLPGCPDPNCATTGWLDPTYLTTEVNYLKSQYPSTFGGLMAWEFSKVAVGTSNDWDTITSALLPFQATTTTTASGSSNSNSGGGSSSGAASLSSWVQLLF